MEGGGWRVGGWRVGSGGCVMWWVGRRGWAM